MTLPRRWASFLATGDIRDRRWPENLSTAARASALVLRLKSPFRDIKLTDLVNFQGEKLSIYRLLT